ncbi:MAG: hypothetical protein QXU20_03645 [Candidatus Woesearchaeota archaeon]
MQDLNTGIEVIVRDVDTNKNPEGIEKHFNEVRMLEQKLKQGKLVTYDFCCDDNKEVKMAYIIKKI